MPGAHIESIRRSLVSLRRLFQRKDLPALWAAAFGGDSRLEYTELRLLDAVREAGAGATVGDVARLLGIDPSRASRLVARAVTGGLLERRAEQRDGRKVVLRVTRRGAHIQDRGSALTRARISLAVADWSRAEREQLAALFERFVDGMITEAAPARRR